MVSPKLIEFVDTGNYGRSPVAEVLANHYLRKSGVSLDYAASSSGVEVNEISHGVSMNGMLCTINLAKIRGIYSSNALSAIDEAVKESDIPRITDFFQYAKNFFAVEEEEGRMYMSQRLTELGVDATIKERQDQTIARADTLAILCLSKKNYFEVLDIYARSRYNPIIAVMSTLATGNLNVEVLNSFGRGAETYKKSFEQLIREVPEAVRRVIRRVE